MERVSLMYRRLFFLMRRRPPMSTRTDTLFPYTTLFRSRLYRSARAAQGQTARGLGTPAADAVPRDPVRRRRRSAAPEVRRLVDLLRHRPRLRSEEHTSELQSLMRISYAVFCLKKKNIYIDTTYHTIVTHTLHITPT